MLTLEAAAVKKLAGYLPYFIAGAVAIGALWYAVTAIHNNGRTVERVEWQDKEASRKAQEAIMITAARAAVKAEAEKQHNGLIEVINAQAELNNKLNDDIASLNDKRMYVDTKASRCDSGGLSTQSDDPGKSSGGTNRIELSKALARQIRNDYFTAQRVVNQYEACRQALMNITVVVE